jgi:uncharacterized protein (TIGR02996 family)
MSAERAFREAIAAEPDDDTPRLIHADWLEDGGRAGQPRAAFIRAQVRLAALPEDHPERPVLEDEADDLLAAHEAEWSGDVSRIALEWDWRGGFIEQVTVSADAFREQGEELLGCAPIRELRLLGAAEELRDLARCRHLEAIEAIDFSATSESSVIRVGMISDEALSALVGSSYLGRLRSLDLSGQRLESMHALASSGLLDRLKRLDLSSNPALGDRAVRVLCEARPAQLEELGVRSTNLTAYGVRGLYQTNWPQLRRLAVNAAIAVRLRDPNGDIQHLLSLPFLGRTENLELCFPSQLQTLTGGLLFDLATAGRATALHELSLTTEAFGPAVRQGLAELVPWRDVQHLNLPGCGIETEAMAALAKAPLGSLRWLSLANNPLKDRGAEALVNADFFPRLTRLNVAGARIGGPGLKTLLWGRWGPLARLDLDGNWVGPSGAFSIAASEATRRLEWLSLNQCNLGPEGARALATSPNVSRLRVLRLRHDSLGDEGVEALAASPYLARLRELYLDGNELNTRGATALLESPYLGRIRRLGLRGSYFGYTEQERLRARFGEGVVF